MKHRAMPAIAVVIASITALAGCAAETTPPPPFGAATLTPPAKKHTVLTVGDSHAVRFSQGMEQVSGGQYQIVNGAYGGCGLMREAQYKLTTYGIDEAQDANHACDDWDVEWRALITKWNPDAVLLTTSYWDANAQKIDDTGTFRLITDKKFRSVYQKALRDGIDILSANGARVYLDNSLPYLGHDMQSAEAMSKAVSEVYAEQKAAGKNVGLLDIRGQVCVDTTCPSSIDGIAVADSSGHPAGESLARQSRWILNTMAADLDSTSE